MPRLMRAALRGDARPAPAVFDNLCELRAPTRAVLESMEIGGKGKALRKELLARAS